MRAVIPFMVTVVLVIVMAPIAGLLFFGTLTGTPQLAASRDLAGVPFLLYAATFTLPSTLPVAVVVAILATVFSYSFGRVQPFRIWVGTFAALGLFLGIACASPMIIACFRDQAMGLGRAWFLFGAVCGMLLMMPLSGLWYACFKLPSSEA